MEILQWRYYSGDITVEILQCRYYSEDIIVEILQWRNYSVDITVDILQWRYDMLNTSRDFIVCIGHLWYYRWNITVQTLLHHENIYANYTYKKEFCIHEIMNLLMCAYGSTDTKNSAYGKQTISRPMQIVAPIPKKSC